MGNSVSASALAGMLQAPTPPVVVDVRKEAAFMASGMIIPSAKRVPPDEIGAAAQDLSGHTVVVYCIHGHEVSQGACVTLRRHGVDATYLEDGFEGWRDSGLPVEPSGEGEKA